MGVAKLKKKLWKVFSEYIRKRDKGVCYTCGRYATGSGYHAGHFISKSICPVSLYFSEENTHGQCFRCNIHLSGNWPNYLDRMITEYGQERVDELLAQRHQTEKWTPADYEEKIEYYKQKLKEL
jgi:hypothetical protein